MRTKYPHLFSANSDQAQGNSPLGKFSFEDECSQGGDIVIPRSETRAPNQQQHPAAELQASFGEQKTYYSPDPNTGTPPSSGSYTPPSHGSRGGHGTPSHGSGGHGGNPPGHHHHHNPTPSPPSGGGGSGYYPSPTPSTPTPSTPRGGYSPTPTTPTTPIIYPGTPSAPGVFPIDPNSPPFTCNYWRTHPALIWGLFGWWGSVGNSFGVASLPGFGSNMNLLQALSNSRTDAYGDLYREGTASLLNSLVSRRFTYTTNQVRDSFVSALSSDKSAAAQAQLFKLANEGRA
ncbi:Protodermal factor 1 [Capsicum annuum]|uniref:Protodermal factor 1 n=1 Tax=Capsicum annuum TaxID=4072 RepID=A0A2G2YT94_CAPAN|nr:Protodermal factor 1 [Capsicum annuum]